MTHAPDKAPSLQNWGTPQDFFDMVNAWGRFTLDVCAEPWNAKCKRYYTKEQNGLAQPWGPNERIWCNPPYSNPRPWLERGWHAAINEGSEVTYLLPAATDTVWFNEFCWCSDIAFIQGRIKFVPPPGYKGKSNSPTFGSVLVTYTPGADKRHEWPYLSAMTRDGKLIPGKPMFAGAA